MTDDQRTQEEIAEDVRSREIALDDDDAECEDCGRLLADEDVAGYTHLGYPLCDGCVENRAAQFVAR